MVMPKTAARVEPGNTYLASMGFFAFVFVDLRHSYARNDTGDLNVGSRAFHGHAVDDTLIAFHDKVWC